MWNRLALACFLILGCSGPERVEVGSPQSTELFRLEIESRGQVDNENVILLRFASDDHTPVWVHSEVDRSAPSPTFVRTRDGTGSWRTRQLAVDRSLEGSWTQCDSVTGLVARLGEGCDSLQFGVDVRRFLLQGDTVWSSVIAYDDIVDDGVAREPDWEVWRDRIQPDSRGGKMLFGYNRHRGSFEYGWMGADSTWSFDAFSGALLSCTGHRYSFVR